jgi:phosphohistidine phosphatase
MDVLGVEEDVVRWNERIYDGGLATLLDVLADCPTSPRRVMLVGHNPGLELLVQHLGGGTVTYPTEGKFFPTAAVAHLRMPQDWRRLGRSAGRAITIMRPRSLREK